MKSRLKLAKLSPRVVTFAGSRKLHTLEIDHEDKRLRGDALIARNRRLMQERPLCVECTKEGKDVGVDEWDHTIPLWKGGIDHETNIQGLCFKHHRIKSERERLEREGIPNALPKLPRK